MSFRMLQFAGIGLSVAVLGVCSYLLVDRYVLSEGAGEFVAAQSPVVGGPFTLVSEAGETVTEATFAGRHTFIYFGFTFCPDICPTELQVLSQAYEQLPDTAKDQVDLIFVTVDPDRDDVEAVGAYTDLFHDEMLGLTGTKEQIAEAARSFRVYYQAVGKEEDPEYYAVDHSSFAYFQGPDNSNVAIFPRNTAPELIAETMIGAIAPQS